MKKFTFIIALLFAGSLHASAIYGICPPSGTQSRQVAPQTFTAAQTAKDAQQAAKDVQQAAKDRQQVEFDAYLKQREKACADLERACREREARCTQREDACKKVELAIIERSRALDAREKAVVAREAAPCSCICHRTCGNHDEPASTPQDDKDKDHTNHSGGSDDTNPGGHGNDDGVLNPHNVPVL